MRFLTETLIYQLGTYVFGLMNIINGKGDTSQHGLILSIWIAYAMGGYASITPEGDALKTLLPSFLFKDEVENVLWIVYFFTEILLIGIICNEIVLQYISVLIFHQSSHSKRLAFELKQNLMMRKRYFKRKSRKKIAIGKKQIFLMHKRYFKRKSRKKIAISKKQYFMRRKRYFNRIHRHIKALKYFQNLNASFCLQNPCAKLLFQKPHF